MAYISSNIYINDDSPPYERISSNGCRSGRDDGGDDYKDPTDYNVSGGTAELKSNELDFAVREFNLPQENNKYMNYGSIAFNYEFEIPNNGCSGYYKILCSQRGNGGELTSQAVASGGAGSASFSCINIDGSSIVIGAWIFNSTPGSTDEPIKITIYNIRVTLVPDGENVFHGDAALSLISDGCAVARMAIKYGKGGEWVYIGDMGGNITSVKIQQISEDTYVMVDFALDCGNGVCGYPPESTTTVSAGGNIVPPGAVEVPDGCSQSFCARPPKHIGDMYYACNSVSVGPVCVQYETYESYSHCDRKYVCGKTGEKCIEYQVCHEYKFEMRKYCQIDHKWREWCIYIPVLVCTKATYEKVCYPTYSCGWVVDPNCSPEVHQYCVKTEIRYLGCNGEYTYETLPPGSSMDDAAASYGYPGEWRKYGVPAPQYIGPVMDTVIDIQVDEWSPSLPSSPWSASCGLCVNYMVGPPWSLPIECTDKEENPINPEEMEEPPDDARQNINNITPRAGGI